MAAEQASEEAQPRHGEAPGAGGHCIPRGWGAGGRGETPRRLLRASPAGRRPRPTGWGPSGPGRGARGAERAGTGRRSGHGRRQALRTGAPPGLVFSACTARGLRGSPEATGAGGFPCVFLLDWERPGPRKPADSPAHTPRDERARSGGGRSVPGAATDGGPTMGCPPLSAPLPWAVAPPSPATSRPYPGVAEWTPLQGRVWGCAFGRRWQQLHVLAGRAPELRAPHFCTNSLPSEPSRALPSNVPRVRHVHRSHPGSGLMAPQRARRAGSAPSTLSANAILGVFVWGAYGEWTQRQRSLAPHSCSCTPGSTAPRPEDPALPALRGRRRPGIGCGEAARPAPRRALREKARRLALRLGSGRT